MEKLSNPKVTIEIIQKYHPSADISMVEKEKKE